jgi:hypothetical protein
VVVDHDRQVEVADLHLSQQFVRRVCLGHEVRRPQQSADGPAAPLVMDTAQQVPGIGHAGDLVDRWFDPRHGVAEVDHRADPCRSRA